MGHIAWLDSPVGCLEIEENGEAITAIRFVHRPDRENDNRTGKHDNLCGGSGTADAPLLAEAVRQLREYFSGSRAAFDLPLAPEGTGFQKRVWKALLEIPYGETRTYGQIAAAVGNPKGGRAVGMANHNNPIPIVIPCHRVIGANGALTGYGGGLDIKRKLLELEGVL